MQNQNEFRLFKPHLYIKIVEKNPIVSQNKYKLSILIPTGKEKYRCNLNDSESIRKSDHQRLPNHPKPEMEKPILVTLTYQDDVADEQYLCIEKEYPKENADKIFVKTTVLHKLGPDHHQGGEGSAHYEDSDDKLIEQSV